MKPVFFIAFLSIIALSSCKKRDDGPVKFHDYKTTQSEWSCVTDLSIYLREENLNQLLTVCNDYSTHEIPLQILGSANGGSCDYGTWFKYSTQKSSDSFKQDSIDDKIYDCSHFKITMTGSNTSDLIYTLNTTRGCRAFITRKNDSVKTFTLSPSAGITPTKTNQLKVDCTNHTITGQM